MFLTVLFPFAITDYYREIVKSQKDQKQKNGPMDLKITRLNKIICMVLMWLFCFYYENSDKNTPSFDFCELALEIIIIGLFGEPLLGLGRFFIYTQLVILFSKIAILTSIGINIERVHVHIMT